MSPSSSLLLLLLLLGLCQAHPLLEEAEEEEDEDPDIIDITTRILTSNNGSDDDVLLEGDLLAPTSRSAIWCWYRGCLWKKAANGSVMIPFTVSSKFTSAERKKIHKAMEVYHSSTCIRFTPRQRERDYISIESSWGCYSYLGRVGGRQVISLKQKGCVYHGVIQHEINHALGFYHEQSRSDRDKYVRINWLNIDPKKVYNFFRQPSVNLNTPYDYSSIMHYGRTAFSINKGKETITPIPDPKVQIGQRKGMSSWDIAKINILYGCSA